MARELSAVVAENLELTHELAGALCVDLSVVCTVDQHDPHFFHVHAFVDGEVSIILFVGRASGLVYAADGRKRGDRLGKVSTMVAEARALRAAVAAVAS